MWHDLFVLLYVLRTTTVRSNPKNGSAGLAQNCCFRHWLRMVKEHFDSIAYYVTNYITTICSTNFQGIPDLFGETKDLRSQRRSAFKRLLTSLERTAPKNLRTTQWCLQPRVNVDDRSISLQKTKKICLYVLLFPLLTNRLVQLKHTETTMKEHIAEGDVSNL